MRLQALIDGRLQCAEPSAPLLASEPTTWAGFPLERNVCHPGGAKSVVFPASELIMVARGSICVEYGCGLGPTRRFVAGAGSITIWPCGHESAPASWTPRGKGTGCTEMLRVQLDPAVIDHLLPEGQTAPVRQLTQHSAVEDSSLAGLMRLMEAEVAAGCPAATLYAESLSLALLAHVGQHYSARASLASSDKRLARPVLERVFDYILGNLGCDLRIVELAAVANMSPHRFCLSFKRSVGLSPHQWLMRKRVEEGSRLLRARSMSIAEVALSLGFSSQSHFTQVFRQLTGTTPKRYQRGLSAH